MVLWLPFHESFETQCESSQEKSVEKHLQDVRKVSQVIKEEQIERTENKAQSSEESNLLAFKESIIIFLVYLKNSGGQKKDFLIKVVMMVTFHHIQELQLG